VLSLVVAYSWESVRSGARSGVLVETDAGHLEAVEVISGVHDESLGDVGRLKGKAMEALVRGLLVEGRSLADWLHVFLAALSDPVFPRLGKSYALMAASTVKSPDVVSVLRALISNRELGYVREGLPGAFYRQGDTYSIGLLAKDADDRVASKAKFFDAALSWETVGRYCPHMDDHAVCLHGVGTDSCPMLGRVLPYDFPRSVSTAKVVVLPIDKNYVFCPRYQSRSPFH